MVELFVFVLLWILSGSQVPETSSYVWIKSISDAQYEDYEGIYRKETCLPSGGGGDCCQDAYPNGGTTYPGWVDPPNIYSKSHRTKGAVYLLMENTWIDVDFNLVRSTPAMEAPLLITHKSGRNGDCPFVTNGSYVLKHAIHYNDIDEWQTATTWSDASDNTVTLDICASDQGALCDLIPTSSPSKQPSSSPSKNPSEAPSKPPTIPLSPSPTAPRVKYQFCNDFSTFMPSGSDFRICLFISSDPMGNSVARISMIGPNDRSWMMFFTETTPQFTGQNAQNAYANDWLRTFNGAAAGYVVNPTDPNAPAGEVFIDQTSGYDYMDYSSYTQNSVITVDVNYKSDQALAIFERGLLTNDAEDWQFTLDHLLNPFYICFIAQQVGVPDFGMTDDKDCSNLMNQNAYSPDRAQIEGNYGTRARWEWDPFTIYMEYHPFTGIYSGQCIKPKDSWIVWGKYYETDAVQTTSGFWHYSTFCDTHAESAGIAAGFTTLFHPTDSSPRVVTTTSSDTQIWEVAVDDLGGNMHRINFSVNATDLDDIATGWNTVQFLATESLDFNVFYKQTATSNMQFDFANKNEVFLGATSVILDYVTYPPTVSPTREPTVSPTSVPSVYPTQVSTQPPTQVPTTAPSTNPTLSPTRSSNDPTSVSLQPTQTPTAEWMPCVERTALFNGAGHIEIAIDAEQKKMQITMSGPMNTWFGIGFGKDVMRKTDAIIMDGANVVQRILGDHNAGQMVDDVLEDTTSESVPVLSLTAVKIVRQWQISGVDDIYDFSDFFEGNNCELPIIWAVGNGMVFSTHSHKDNSLSLRSCNCAEVTTDEPTESNAPTTDPTANPVPPISNATHSINVSLHTICLCFFSLLFFHLNTL